MLPAIVFDEMRFSSCKFWLFCFFHLYAALYSSVKKLPAIKVNRGGIARVNLRTLLRLAAMW